MTPENQPTQNNEQTGGDFVSQVKPAMNNKPLEISPTQQTNPLLLKGILIFEWLAYVPLAFVIFALSAMAGDSPYASEWRVGLLMLLVNGAPLLILALSTGFALRKKSYFIALLPMFILFLDPFSFFSRI